MLYLPLGLVTRYDDISAGYKPINMEFKVGDCVWVDRTNLKHSDFAILTDKWQVTYVYSFGVEISKGNRAVNISEKHLAHCKEDDFDSIYRKLTDPPLKMAKTDNSIEIKQLIGGIVINLQTLEFLIRVALCKFESPPHAPFAAGVNINELNVGDIVPINALTDYSSLGQLIARFNNEIANGDVKLLIDPTIVEIRDVLAHGRASSSTEDGDRKILKFTRPAQGATTVQVQYTEELTVEFLKTKSRNIHGAAMVVLEHLKD